MMSTADHPIVIEQAFNAPVSEVWKAITVPEEMKQWFFSDIPDFKPVVGFETRFSVRSEERNFEHIWKILAVKPGRMIRYHWSYEEYEGEGRVTFDLFEKDGKTLLRLTNEGLESFPRDVPEFSRESCEAGWNYFIGDSLSTYLTGRSPVKASPVPGNPN
jgi:uncharacterized protein YndB with AHSA1/START domain